MVEERGVGWGIQPCIGGYQMNVAETADKIIEYLCTRKGFDDWWHGVEEDNDDDVCGEIKTDIAKIIIREM